MNQEQHQSIVIFTQLLNADFIDKFLFIIKICIYFNRIANLSIYETVCL